MTPQTSVCFHTPLRVSAACHRHRGHVSRIDNTAPRFHILFPMIKTHPSIFGPLSLDVKKSMYFPAKSNYLERLFKNSDPLTLLRHSGGALRCILEPCILKTWKALGILICSHELRDSTRCLAHACFILWTLDSECANAAGKHRDGFPTLL